MFLVMALMLIGSAIFFGVLALAALRAEEPAAPSPPETDSVSGLRTFAGATPTDGAAAVRDAPGRVGTVHRTVWVSRN